MKQPPNYPDYRVVDPPVKLRWGIAVLVISLLCTFITVWVWPPDKPIRSVPFWFWVAGLPLLLMSLLFAVRSLIYQVALSNRQSYRDVLHQASEQWWEHRSLGLPLEYLCLLGPVGDKPEHHLAVLTQDAVAPAPTMIAEGMRVLRCPQVLENDVSRRESALTRHLVLTLLDISPANSEIAPVFHRVYWCGSHDHGQLFIQLLSEQGWQFQTPALPLNDIDDLDKAIDAFHDLSGDKNVRLLCAGIYQPHSDDHTQVMGEAGFAWVVGGQGKSIIHRAERQDSLEETPQMLSRQVMRYANLTVVPEDCISLHKMVAENLQSSEWPTLSHIVQPFWGDLQQIAPFITLSIAAIHSLETQTSCGWITQDKADKCIIGVITVD